jgi:NMD protein affecting ribosome stability and mRNA decay
MVTGLFELCITVFSENPPSEQEQLYPRMKADEVQSAVLDSTDNVFSAYCKQTWMTPNREDIKTNLKLLFKVCPGCQKSMSISLNSIVFLRQISRNMEIDSLPSCSLKSKNCQTSLMSLMSLLFSSKI